jgi:UDP-2,4-diacetamido-2,4,6-trideoxy-beta-L-altropyranose hydrolase
MGTGHVMRCLALAQERHDAGVNATFVMAVEAPALETRLREERVEIVHLSAMPGSEDDAIQTRQLARQKGAHWVVADGYHFGGDYQRIIKDSALRLLFVDDYGHAEHYYADIVLNQNFHAHEGLYVNREPYTQLLLGTDYVLLRREFREWRKWNRKIPKMARKVLVTLGGSDQHNQTLKVMKALQQMEVEGLEAMVVIGANNPHFGELQATIHNSQFAVRLAQNVADMSDLMAWADIAITAGGSTAWELAFMGLPSLVLILADNQRPVADRLDSLGVSVNLGSYRKRSSAKITQAVTQLLEAPERRAEMAQQGRGLVDGWGVARVLESLI